MDEMRNFLREIGITDEPLEGDDDCLYIDFTDSAKYGSYYSKLDKSDLVEEEADVSLVTYEASSIQYVSVDGTYTITLIADLDADTYRLNIREN